MTDDRQPLSPSKRPATATGGRRIVCLGLLGLPGAGKSTIAKLLAERGCTVLDADALVTEAYAADEVRDAIRAELGDDLFDELGQPQRQAIAALVFADKEALRRLEGILHPWVRRRMGEHLETLREDHETGRATDEPVAVLDVPLLAEGGLEAQCDAFMFVKASFETRLARRGAERGWDALELQRREAAQWTAQRKRAVVGDRPLWTISNDGDLSATRRALDACWQEFVSLWKED